MELIKPRFIALDTCTLGTLAQDYFHHSQNLRDKARQFVADLVDRGMHITLTYTHVCELLRHENDDVVEDRLRFLRQIPLLAWIRPYSKDWIPGYVADLFRLELHEFVHHKKRTWQDIIDAVRGDLFETATGGEMFIDGLPVWDFIRETAQHHQKSETVISSIGRTDPQQVKNMTMRQVSRLEIRDQSEMHQALRSFAHNMGQQLRNHGDKRLTGSADIAKAFAADIAKKMKVIDSMGDNKLQAILDYWRIPDSMVRPEMTVEDVSELGSFLYYMKTLGQKLKPSVELEPGDVPLDSLPSHALTRKLEFCQRTADRVSGSDFGDRGIVPLVLYADAVQVDKRTNDYLSRICKSDCRFRGLVRHHFKANDYPTIPQLLV